MNNNKFSCQIPPEGEPSPKVRCAGINTRTDEQLVTYTTGESFLNYLSCASFLGSDSKCRLFVEEYFWHAAVRDAMSNLAEAVCRTGMVRAESAEALAARFCEAVAGGKAIRTTMEFAEREYPELWDDVKHTGEDFYNALQLTHIKSKGITKLYVKGGMTQSKRSFDALRADETGRMFIMKCGDVFRAAVAEECAAAVAEVIGGQRKLDKLSDALARLAAQEAEEARAAREGAVELKNLTAVLAGENGLSPFRVLSALYYSKLNPARVTVSVASMLRGYLYKLEMGYEVSRTGDLMMDVLTTHGDADSFIDEFAIERETTFGQLVLDINDWFRTLFGYAIPKNILECMMAKLEARNYLDVTLYEFITPVRATEYTGEQLEVMKENRDPAYIKLIKMSVNDWNARTRLKIFGPSRKPTREEDLDDTFVKYAKDYLKECLDRMGPVNN